MKIPAVCGSCGHVFPSILTVHGSARTSNLATVCPKCGSHARIIDGYFDILDGLVKLVDGPGFSEETVGLLYGAARYVKKNPAHRRYAIEKVAKKNKVAAVALDRWIEIGIQFATLMILLASLLHQYKTEKGNRPFIEVTIENSDEMLKDQHGMADVDAYDDALEEGQTDRNPAIKRPAPSKIPAAKNRKQRRAEFAKIRRGTVRR